LSFKITGWTEGHPALTCINDYPFGCAKPQCLDPTSEESRGKKMATRQVSMNCTGVMCVVRERQVESSISPKRFLAVDESAVRRVRQAPFAGGKERTQEPYLYNGLDRLDSNGGYVLGNVAGCCGEHNRIKSDLTYEDLFKHCLAVVLSELSKTATANNDIETLERLIDLFPNVLFLREHHASVWQVLATNPWAVPFTPEMALPRERRGVRRYPDRPIRPKAPVVEPKVKRASK